MSKRLHLRCCRIRFFLFNCSYNLKNGATINRKNCLTRREKFLFLMSRLNQKETLGIIQHGIKIENNYNPSTNLFLFLVEFSLLSTRSFEDGLVEKSESSTRNKNGLVEGF